jgi:hypothetical protein
MKISLTGMCAIAIAGVMILTAATESRAQDNPFYDAAIMINFQRATDSYAFTHRQRERHGEWPAAGVEGTLFTPIVSDAFRKRIRRATAGGACKLPDTAIRDFSVPRVNAPVDSSPGVPACIASMLPRLPEELEYRVAGVALLLVDAHLHIVVDVLHAAFPVPDEP